MPARISRGLSRVSAVLDGLPIRTRLAGVSALLTFVILCAFAIAIGSLTVHRIRSDFNHDVGDSAQQLPSQLHLTFNPTSGHFEINPPLADVAAEHAEIRLLADEGNVVAKYPANGPALGSPGQEVQTVNGYRVISKTVIVKEPDGLRRGVMILQYGRPVASTEATVKRVELFLILGVLAGSALALLAGIAIARRAMAPIASLTSAAAEIARTRDLSRSMPEPHAEDEVSELARTLEGMLRELDAARGETEAALARQRQFVADASHELRTPLTSVLANLELLAESLHGDEGDAARSALRSSQRMRRLVADLLLLARTDAARVQARSRCDLGQVVVEAAAELGPISEQHEISLDIHSTPVLASRDELHRLAINLIENAVRHTPPGTEIRISASSSSEGAQLVVEDNGPGVPEALAPTLFERFVRGAGDRGGSFGLGLAIVRAVAESHGGSVMLDRTAASGARFVVRLPAASDLNDDGQHHRPSLETVVDQLR